MYLKNVDETGIVIFTQLLRYTVIGLESKVVPHFFTNMGTLITLRWLFLRFYFIMK